MVVYSWWCTQSVAWTNVASPQAPQDSGGSKLCSLAVWWIGVPAWVTWQFSQTYVVTDSGT